jgi:hypothetical protein
MKESENSIAFIVSNITNWKDINNELKYLESGERLLEYGIPLPEVHLILTNLFYTAGNEIKKYYEIKNN